MQKAAEGAENATRHPRLMARLRSRVNSTIEFYDGFGELVLNGTSRGMYRKESRVLLCCVVVGR